MKKKTGIYNGIFSRKWRLIFITLVLIFSVISISVTGAESGNNSQARNRIVHESNTGVSNETEDNCLYCIVDENYTNKSSYSIEDEENLEQKVGENKSKENQETVENSTKSKTGIGKSKETKEKVENSTKSKTRTEKSTETKEKMENSTKSKTVIEKSKETKEKMENSTKSKTVTEKSKETKEKVENSTKSKMVTEKNKTTQKTVENNNKSKIETEENKTTQKTVENNNKLETRTGKSKETKEKVENSTKSKTVTKKRTTNQEIVEDIEQETDLADSILHYKVYKIEENKSKGNQETVEEDTNLETNKDTASQEKIEENESKSSEANGSNWKLKVKTVNKTVAQENESESNETDSQENIEENESKSSEANVSNWYETITANGTVAQENESESNETNSQENIEENESKSSEANVPNWYKTITANKTVTQENESESNETDSQENIEENESKSSEANGSNWYKTITANKTVAQENESESNETDSQENIEENESKSSKSDGSNWKLKVKTANGTVAQENKSDSSESNISNLKYEIITVNETVNELKNLTSTEVETENRTKTSNGTSNSTKSVESEVVSPEVNWTNSLVSQEVKVYNWTDSQGNESVTPEVKTEKNSWNNIKFILSYSYPLRSFYTTKDSVNISYNGPETLGQQNIDIYLIKEYSPSSPENEILYGTNNSTICLEDFLNNDTEAYVKIPATLNKEGDLAPLTLDSLQAGHYWILITPAGNETEKTGSGKEILLAKYFEVLKYQMEDRSPYALQEGKNLEVNLDLKNAPAEKNYTYWAVLMKDGAYTAFEGTNPRWMMTTGIRPIVNGVDLIKSLETNLSGYESENLSEYESENGKDELQNEIQTLIGKDNGTISIGEKNQSKLSLKSLDLPPGDYLLITGTYENNEGLTGITQKKLRISPENVSGLGLEPSSEDTFGDESSTKLKASPLTEIKFLLENPKSFILEDVKPYIQTNSLAEVLRNPPKLPSFLLGFAVTLLVGFAVLRKKK